MISHTDLTTASLESIKDQLSELIERRKSKKTAVDNAFSDISGFNVSELLAVATQASDYFEMCPLNWRVQETGPYSYTKYEDKEANMKFSKTFGPALVTKLLLRVMDLEERIRK